MSLTEYKRKRHFDRTPEPAGSESKAAKAKAAKSKTTARKAAGRKANGRQASAKSLSFVVQKHDASRLHYDFRLELDGVLKSWAVPKGPSFDPHEKRLAVEVEDHPIDYADFEGIIPEGEYGGGTVAVWDRGTWLPDGDPHAGIRTGKLKFHLEGEKLRGGWTLVRMARRERDRATNWLLIKERDDDARPLDEYDVEQAEPTSVISGRTIDEIAQDQDRVWGSNRRAKKESQATKSAASRSAKKSSSVKRSKAAKPRRTTAKKTQREPKARRNGKKSADKTPAGSHAPAIPAGARRAKMPGTVKMQLATLAKAPPEGDRWLHEIKLDGYRIICRLQGGHAQLITRGDQDWTARMPGVARAAERLSVNDAILDGEVVALLPSGVSSFQALQNAFRGSRAEPLIYYAFDLLYLDGHDLRGLPLDERKKLLAELLAADGGSQPGQATPGTIRYTEHVEGEGAHFFAEACRLGLEGSIAKRRDRPYSPGRSYDWLKIKCVSREEFVIGGFTDPEGARRGLGSLLVGFHRGGKLIYAGHVGTGFSDRLLVDLRQRLDRLAQSRSPFADFPLRSTPRGTHWVKPQLVGQVEFSNWTDDGRLRHPSFQGLREDKPANTVTRDDPRDLAELDAGGTAASNGHANTNGATMKKHTAAKQTTERQKQPKRATTKRKPAKRTIANRKPTAKTTGNGVPTSVAKPVAHQRPQAAARDLHEVAGVRLTHPDRVLYPEQGITKLGLASFYVEIADWILPHVADRPLSLLRCPTGRGQACFYQKHLDASAPAALGRVTIQEKDTTGVYSVVRDIAGVVALVQMGVLEIHPWGSRADDVERPDRLTIDLDPSGEVDWPAVAEGARRVRKLLRSVGLESFVKTSGGKGLHVVAPIQRRLTWPDLKAFCKAIAQRMATDSPDEFTTSPLKAARKNKTFVDYLRNERGATSVAAYSTRARQGAPVSTPVGWDELDSDLRSDYFNVENLPARLKKLRRNPWRELAGLRQSITASARKALGL